MSEHTKGNWEVSNQLPYIIAVTSPHRRGKVIVSRGKCTGGQDWPALEQEEYEANARLIAAAPVLLAACEAAFVDISRLLFPSVGDYPLPRLEDIHDNLVQAVVIAKAKKDS